MLTTYSRLFVLLLALFPFAASASSLRLIHPNDPSVEFSHGWSISPSGAWTTKPGASFSLVLPLGATRVFLLGSSSFNLTLCLDCRRPGIHRSKIFSANSNVDHSSTVLFDLKVDPHTSHVLTVTNVLDPRLDATGKLSLDALVVATQQVTRFVESNALPRDLSSIFMNAGSLLEALGRLFPNTSSSNSTSPTRSLASPSPTGTDTGGSSLGSGTSRIVSSPSDAQSSRTTVSTPLTSSSSQSPFSSTSHPPTSPVQLSSDPSSDASSLSEASPSSSPSLRNSSTRPMSKSTVAVLVLISLFFVLSLVLGGIALWMTRVRSKVATSENGEEQANVDNIDGLRPPNTITTAAADWLYDSRPPSDGSRYSDPHSPRPSVVSTRRTHWHQSSVASTQLEAPPSMRELERGQIVASPPLSAHSLGLSEAHEVEINNVIRRAGMGQSSPTAPSMRAWFDRHLG